MKTINPSLCARCKGYKKLCGLPKCPLLERYKWQLQSISLIKDKEVNAPSPPSILVGEHGYPYIRIYFSTAPGSLNPKLHDDPQTWAKQELELDRIIALRSQTVSGIMRTRITDVQTLYSKEISLAAVSSHPVFSEIILEKKPSLSIKFNGVTKPIGPSSPAKKIVIEDNPRVPRIIEKIFWDDIKSIEAIWKLYNNGLDIYTIIKAFALGMTGNLRERKIVPTRWSITAVDTHIGNKLLSKIRSFNIIDSIEIYHGSYIGNNYTIVLLPSKYEAEWIEIWYPSSFWASYSKKPVLVTVRENYNGKFDKMDGGYLAARFSILEALYRRRRQASVLIIREVFPSYYAPVGNWQIRETVKKILINSPVNKLVTIESLLKQLPYYIRYNVKDLIKISWLLRKELNQARIDKWL